MVGPGLRPVLVSWGEHEWLHVDMFRKWLSGGFSAVMERRTT